MVLNGTKEILLREGNGWDVSLNYFFAMFFIFCFVLGIFICPFIIAYHAKQNKTFAKFLFLTVSSIDQFKLIYFPLMLVPKLISPLEDKDYYIIYNPTSVSWIAYPNFFLNLFVRFEMDAVVILSVSRYFSIAHPLYFSVRKNIVFKVVFILSMLKWILSPVMGVYVFKKILMFYRISNTFAFTSYEGPFRYIFGGSTAFFVVVGAIFVALTIHHLKNSDTASSELSSQNIRRGIISLIATSLFNVLVLLSAIFFQVILTLRLSKDKMTHSTMWDFVQFGVVYGIPLIQSVFNSLSFLLISTSFREFARRSVREKRIASVH